MKNRSPEIDDYIESAAPFAQPILVKIRAAFHAGCPGVEERLKWGSPSFEHEGMLGGMVAFKQHVGFGFWKASLMQDPAGLFGGAPKASPMRIKIRDVRELPTKKLLVGYVKEAVRLNESGIKLPRKKTAKKSKGSLKLPPDLRAAIAADAKAHATWKAFSYSHQKEYVEWITEAKREATREKRMSQAIAWMAEGKSRNWKYR